MPRVTVALVDQQARKETRDFKELKVQLEPPEQTQLQLAQPDQLVSQVKLVLPEQLVSQAQLAQPDQRVLQAKRVPRVLTVATVLTA